MTRFAAFSLLLCLCCLLSRPATAQPVSPLPARVVQLVPGDVVRERLVGLDSVTYQTARQAVALVPAADAALADRARELAATRQQLAASTDELRQARAALTASERDYQQLLSAARQVAGKPPARPALLDWHTYAGAVAGALALAGYLVLR